MFATPPRRGTLGHVDDDRLLAELEPSAVKLYERHLSTAKEWFPHEMVPWSRGRDYDTGEAWDPEQSRLCEGARSALFLNILTEDNLPHYYRTISAKFGNDDVWGEWNRRWTAEEGRHAIVIRDYLAVNRSIDMRALERARMRQVSLGLVPNPDGIADGIVYVALQELATRISHRNTGKLLDDPEGLAIMSRVAADENLHHLFYRDLVSAALEIDPSGMIAAIERQVRTFEMPGAGIEDFKVHARVIADAGVYDFAAHHDQILVPVVFKHWRVEQLENLKAAGEQARERLVKHVNKVGNVAKRMKSRLAPRTAPAI
ncbi:MAG: acyl-[acyl-carrier-protein] desaturase [Actinomycetota bacterium]|nr:acyl-[acyl-carrier-protein] desaturase [Actinomycetota bacterium]